MAALLINNELEIFPKQKVGLLHCEEFFLVI